MIEKLKIQSLNKFQPKNTASFLLFTLTLFFIATLPSMHSLSFAASWYNEKRLAQIIILTALFLILVFSYHFQKFVLDIIVGLPLATKLLLIIFFTFGVISSSISVLPLWAFLEVGNYFLLGLLALFIAYSIKNNINAEKAIVLTFCISAALYLVAFIASLAAGLSNGVVDYHHLLSGFINRRFLNQFQSISFPILLIAPFFLNAGRGLFLTLSTLAAFWFMLMLVSDGRGVVFASLIGLTLSCILIPYYRVRWLIHVVYVIVLGSLLFLGFDYLLSNNEIIKGEVFRDSSGGRVVIWLQLIETIQENPLFGIGPMHYAVLPQPFPLAHPHNITLQLIAEYGIPAALSLIVVISSSFILWAKQQRQLAKKNQTLVPTALTASFIAAVIHGHLSGVFVMPLSQLSFIVICGWMIGLLRKNKINQYDEHEPFSFANRSTLIVASILCTSALLVGSYPSIKSLLAGGTPKSVNLDPNSQSSNAPRYWSGTYR